MDINGQSAAGSDPLHDAIRVAGARGSVGSRLEAGGAWGLRLDAAPWAALHVVLSGNVWVEVADDRPRRVDQGDVVWLPAGIAHGLAGRPGLPMGPCDRDAAERARRSGTTMQLGQPPSDTRLLTLHYTRDPEVDVPAMVALASPLTLRMRDHPTLVAVGQLLDDELSRPGLGTTAALNSLVDLLLVQLVRAWTAHGSSREQEARLGTPLDPVTRDAVSLMHRQPGRPWTASLLARSIGVSRATLARRFHRALGQTPGSYLTGCRMDLAALRLRDTHESIGAIARSVGYSSPHAFSRAFHRRRGSSPRDYRAAHSTSSGREVVTP